MKDLQTRDKTQKGVLVRALVTGTSVVIGAGHEKVKRFFDVPEPVPLEEGVARMAAWVLKVGSRKTREFANIEIPRVLPAGW